MPGATAQATGDSNECDKRWVMSGGRLMNSWWAEKRRRGAGGNEESRLAAVNLSP
jgi:hypothetical protein